MGASPGQAQAAKPELGMNYFQASIHSVETAQIEELRISTERVVELTHLLVWPIMQSTL